MEETGPERLIHLLKVTIPLRYIVLSTVTGVRQPFILRVRNLGRAQPRGSCLRVSYAVAIRCQLGLHQSGTPKITHSHA